MLGYEMRTSNGTLIYHGFLTCPCSNLHKVEISAGRPYRHCCGADSHYCFDPRIPCSRGFGIRVRSSVLTL